MKLSASRRATCRKNVDRETPAARNSWHPPRAPVNDPSADGGSQALPTAWSVARAPAFKRS